MVDRYTIRTANPTDQAFITDMQYEAFFVPPGGDPFPRQILEEPHIRPYHEQFGDRSGDIGVIAETVDGRPLGAAWVRQVKGYGFVDADTPELGIAVIGDRRGTGVGTALLNALFERTPRCSLSVDTRNAAKRLYDRFGFVLVRLDGEYSAVMLRDGDGS